MRFDLLALSLAFTTLGCNDCSSRRSDELLEREVDHVLAQWPASVDAGVVELQRLEAALSEALAVNPVSLTALLADPSATLENSSSIDGEGTATFTIPSRERAVRFVHEIAKGQGLVASFEMVPDAGAQVAVWYLDPDGYKPEIYPPWTPAPSDLWPCWGCRDRAERIVQKSALANELNGKLQRLRQLSRAQKRLKDFDRYRPSPKLLAAFDAVVAAKPSEQFLVKLVNGRGSLFLCRADWSVEQCNERLAGAGVCSLNAPFANEAARPKALAAEARGEVCPLEVKP